MSNPKDSTLRNDLAPAGSPSPSDIAYNNLVNLYHTTSKLVPSALQLHLSSSEALKENVKVILSTKFRFSMSSAGHSMDDLLPEVTRRLIGGWPIPRKRGEGLGDTGIATRMEWAVDEAAMYGMHHLLEQRGDAESIDSEDASATARSPTEMGTAVPGSVASDITDRAGTETKANYTSNPDSSDQSHQPILLQRPSEAPKPTPSPPTIEQYLDTPIDDITPAFGALLSVLHGDAPFSEVDISDIPTLKSLTIPPLLFLAKRFLGGSWEVPLPQVASQMATRLLFRWPVLRGQARGWGRYWDGGEEMDFDTMKDVTAIQEVVETGFMELRAEWDKVEGRDRSGVWDRLRGDGGDDFTESGASRRRDTSRGRDTSTAGDFTLPDDDQSDMTRSFEQL